MPATRGLLSALGQNRGPRGGGSYPGGGPETAPGTSAPDPQNLTLCFPVAGACGDGELDLSGIDDLEIDRVSSSELCAVRVPGRRPTGPPASGVSPLRPRGP